MRKGYGGEDEYDFHRTKVEGNKIKDLQNFLSQAPLQVFNLKPNEQGLIIYPLPKEMENYQSLSIIAYDNDSAAQRNLSIEDIIQAR